MHEQKYDENYDEVRRWRNEKVNLADRVDRIPPRGGLSRDSHQPETRHIFRLLEKSAEDLAKLAEH